METKLLTIFTPTYNRAYCLRNCYESLKRQTCSNFVWQIVDDGSTDDTTELVASFQTEQLISIEYVWQPNGGKASAINKNLESVTTPLWLCLDSDDILTPQAVEYICGQYPTIQDKNDICGLFAVRSDKDLQPMTGKDVPAEVEYATQGYIRYKLGVKPEYAQVYKTVVVRQYRFPIFAGEKFVTECYVQDQIDQEYKFKIVHEPLMISVYLEDGYTNHYWELIAKNPNGFMAFYYRRLTISPYWKSKIKSAIIYNALSHEKGRLQTHKRTNLLIALTSLPGWLCFKKRIKPCLMYRDPVSGMQFVRVREKFQNHKKALYLLAAFYKLFPLSVRKRWFIGLRKTEGTLALGLRYALLKSIARKCGDAVAVYTDVYLLHPENMEIGSNVTFQPMAYIEAAGGINIGDDCSVAHHATIISESHVYEDANVPFKNQGMIRKPIIIGQDVWIGAKATILCGVNVGDKSVIGANSVVNKDVSPYSVMVGTPAKCVKKRHVTGGGKSLIFKRVALLYGFYIITRRCA